MSEHQERQSARDKLYQRTQELASSSQKFATIGVQALGAGINDIKANSKVQEGASSVTSSVRKIGERLNEIKANYADLLRIHYRKLEESPATKLKVIQKRLEDIFELLNAW